MKIYHEIPALHHTAIALGCFDGVHLGHLAVINALETYKAKELDTVVFSFLDETPYKKDSEHLASFEDKCAILADHGIHHLIVPPFESVRDYPPEKFMREILRERLGAEALVCGENYRFGKSALGDAETLKQFCQQECMACHIVPPVQYDDDMISSTRIRMALKNGKVDEASRMLGRLFSYKLTVVKGRQLGRQLGTPTINQSFPAHFLIPHYGVYASVTEIRGKRYASVTNIGVKPTVGWHQPLSETWIPDYTGDLYGQSIRVSLVRFMRDECKFRSVEELKDAILQDGVNAKCLTAKYI